MNVIFSIEVYGVHTSPQLPQDPAFCPPSPPFYMPSGYILGELSVQGSPGLGA